MANNKINVDKAAIVQGLSKFAGVCIVILLIIFTLASCNEDQRYNEHQQWLEEQDREAEELMQEEEDARQAEIEHEAKEAGAIDWTEAEDHIGEYVTIFGVVEEVSQPGVSGDPIFVDIGGSYPSDRVTGVCWSEYHSAFDDLFSYEGNPVLMEGTLYMHEGTPNIELTDSFQIEAL